MAVVFKHRYKSDSLIGTGTYKFRPYTVASPLPQLATPQNVSAAGTTVSWDEVENATSYAVLADGASIGTVEAVTNLISFTIAGTSYQAEEGMTWEEWVNSSYNTGRYHISGSYVINGVSQYVSTQNKDNSAFYVGIDDTISDGSTYYVLGAASGGGSGK